MINKEVFTHMQPQGGSDPAHTAVGVGGIDTATPAFTPLMIDATSKKLVVWDGTNAGQAVGVLALDITANQPRITYYKSGTFRVEDVKWPESVKTDEMKFNAFAGTSVSVI
ncbi:Bacteriophage lambda head decoration protein D [Serratia rubidaea]|uniref:Bacteriophage lambda head decoration protein D n=1 Tax=Serratia rubidaea TaxID=61652 RepID=A0A447QEV1_SERRU|nr:Bacteriophage lambda head decoration protein D [Serratia rubidaea]